MQPRQPPRSPPQDRPQDPRIPGLAVRPGISGIDFSTVLCNAPLSGPRESQSHCTRNAKLHQTAQCGPVPRCSSGAAEHHMWTISWGAPECPTRGRGWSVHAVTRLHRERRTGFPLTPNQPQCPNQLALGYIDPQEPLTTRNHTNVYDPLMVLLHKSHQQKSMRGSVGSDDQADGAMCSVVQT